MLNIQKENNQTLLELKKEIGEIKTQFDLLQPIIPLSEDDINLTWDNEESIEDSLSEEIIKKPSTEENKTTTPEINKVEETKKETHSAPTKNIIKKIWYITKISQDNSLAKISFDEIIILSKEQCDGLEICFKNENKKVITFALDDGVEIESYFVNYLVSWEIRETKRIYLPCFLEFFAEDNSKEYTWFNKIPYRITIENGQVTKIEEQTVVGLYE